MVRETQVIDGASYESFRESCNHWWVIAIATLLIGGGGIIAISLVQTLLPEPYIEYAVVFDAGSSHTSMAIYSWPGKYINGTALVSQMDSCSAPALTSSIDTPEKTGDILVKCLKYAVDKVPPSAQKDSHIYLGATAGLRLLSLSNPQTLQIMLMSIRKTIKSFPFKVFNDTKQARVLSGYEEGIYGWITSNYLSGNLNESPPKDLRAVKSTYGALDMGGASTEITFVPDMTSGVIIPPKYVYDSRLYGTNYSLYTHSFLCYGINEAWRQLNALVVKEAEFNKFVENPCQPDGNETYWTYDELFFNQPCTKHLNVSKTKTKEGLYEISGTSEPEKCSSLVNKLFDFSICSYTNCSFNNVYQPPLTGNFMAFSGYYSIMEFLNETLLKPNLTSFTNKTMEFCSLSWDEIKDYPTSYPQGLETFCFEAVFTLNILTEGFGFNEENWENIHFINKIGKSSVGWSLGFMLSESNLIPQELPHPPISNVVFTLVMFLFVVITFFSIGFACFAFKRHNRRLSYSPL